jgi:hypothetical protein
VALFAHRPHMTITLTRRHHFSDKHSGKLSLGSGGTGEDVSRESPGPLSPLDGQPESPAIFST